MYRLHKKYDIEKIKAEYQKVVDTIGWDNTKPAHFNSISLQAEHPNTYHRPIDDDKFYVKYFKEEDKETFSRDNGLYTHLLIPKEWEMAKFIIENKLTRSRLLRISPQFCYDTHKDWTDRCQLGIVTNENCYYIEDGVSYNIPDDGYGYVTQTTNWHRAMNKSLVDRVNLVGCIDWAKPQG
jgi:hypothetical protein|tara:strand:- start:254 stop:796 length:543 start_codon:yes stop_codon:yes gene_type:complete